MITGNIYLVLLRETPLGKKDIVEMRFGRAQIEALFRSSPCLLNGTRGRKDLQADRERVGQVMTNLLSNAIKYSPRESRIIIRTEQTGAAVKVSIQDEGYGISEEHRQKIFERFYRANSGNAGTSQGIGLGLYIAEQIIKRHRGVLDVQSKTGKGSVFSFTLPL